jgi:hypothetical protein
MGLPSSIPLRAKITGDSLAEWLILTQSCDAMPGRTLFFRRRSGKEMGFNKTLGYEQVSLKGDPVYFALAADGSVPMSRSMFCQRRHG